MKSWLLIKIADYLRGIQVEPSKLHSDLFQFLETKRKSQAYKIPPWSSSTVTLRAAKCMASISGNSKGKVISLICWANARRALHQREKVFYNGRPCGQIDTFNPFHSVINHRLVCRLRMPLLSSSSDDRSNLAGEDWPSQCHCCWQKKTLEKAYSRGLFKSKMITVESTRCKETFSLWRSSLCSVYRLPESLVSFSKSLRKAIDELLNEILVTKTRTISQSGKQR